MKSKGVKSRIAMSMFRFPSTQGQHQQKKNSSWTNHKTETVTPVNIHVEVTYTLIYIFLKLSHGFVPTQ